MPKSKPSKKKDDTSDSDSGPEDRGPAPKKPKSDTKKESDEDSWELAKNRFIKLSEFKGKWYVNIREYYDSDGVLKPGKKGIMLTMEQWQKFKQHIDDIDEAIKRRV